MSVETRKVLEMLAAGKITQEDAERLLDKLNAVPKLTANNPLDSRDNAGPTTPRKYLRVVVSGAGKDVNMRVPLSFVRSGVGLMGVLPAAVAEKLDERGIDLDAFTELEGDELDEALNALNVEIDNGKGKQVRIFCE